MRVLAAFRDNAANYYRLQCPAMVLKQQGLDVDIKRLSLDDVGEYDVLWLQMHAEPVVDIVMREFKEAGKRVVYDVDDWVFGLPPSWASYDHYFQRGSGLPTERLKFHERALRCADLVTCTTDYLRIKLSVYCNQVVTLPNCVMMGDWDILPEVHHSLGGPVLGWFGTGNHWDDWREIVRAVDEALAQVGGYLALMGAPELLVGFPARLRARTLVSPIAPISRFHTLRSLVKGCDVGLAWATDSLEVSLCRSPLKALQWGAAGVPFLASATVYGDVLRHTSMTTAMLGSLSTQLVELLEMPDSPRRQMALSWQEQVWKQHSYESQSSRWLKILKGDEDCNAQGCNEDK